jgi:hypothetical protein
MTALSKIYDCLFGCLHAHTTKPITRRMAPLEPLRTYVVCLDCGHEIDYDLTRMCLVPGRGGKGKDAA